MAEGRQATRGKNKRQLWPEVSQEGKTVIVTGANSGIGYETTRALAELGANVIMACRSEDSTLKARAQLQEDHKQDGRENELNLEFMALDLSSLESVMQFVTEFKKKGCRLHTLVCNAGIVKFEKGHTSDEYEQHFQINYLGHVLLTLHLLPVLKASGDDVRIINVSSSVHTSGKFDVNNIQAQGRGSYNGMGFYGNSKLFQVMFTCTLQEKLGAESNVSVFSLHPGAVATRIDRNRHENWMLRIFWPLGKTLGFVTSDIRQGASTTVLVAVDPEVLKHRGCYFVDRKLANPSTKSSNKTTQKELWDYTMNCLNKYITQEELEEAMRPITD